MKVSCRGAERRWRSALVWKLRFDRLSWAAVVCCSLLRGGGVVLPSCLLLLEGSRSAYASEATAAGDASGSDVNGSVVDGLVIGAVEDFEAGRYPLARSKLEDAHHAAPSYRTATLLGQVELYVGAYRDAAEHLAEALARMPPASDKPLRSKVEAGLSEARLHVCSWTVDSSVRPAHVEVDGRAVVAVAADGMFFLSPGAHSFRVTSAGYADYVGTAPCAAGQRQVLRAVLRPLGAGVAPEQGRRETHWRAAVLATGATLLVASAAYAGKMQTDAWAFERSAQDASRAAEERYGKGVCGRSTPFDCLNAKLLEAWSRSRQKEAYLGYGAAGLAVLGTASLLLLLPLGDDSEAALAPELALLSGAGVSLRGRF